VFLDECVDWRLSRRIAGHDVKTARQMGWLSIKNGELLALASRSFDVFVTVDRNLSFQQNLGVLPNRRRCPRSAQQSSRRLGTLGATIVGGARSSAGG
jgi:hypothetical protein